MMEPSLGSESAEAILQQIAAAVQDLYWMSETDAPFEVLHWTNISPGGVTPTGDLTSAQVLYQAQLPSGTPVEVISLSDFLAPATQRQSWHADEDVQEIEQFLALQILLTQNLTQIQVYCFGITELEIYIVGKALNSHWLALHTRAVQT
jgi:Nuclease A inhibitor-like protein